MIRVGTRGSALALAQARLVTDRLGDAEVVVIRTAGDASSRSLRELGDGAFVIALEDALRRGEVDAAVHSLKDLPTGERDGLVVAAVPEREDPRDALVTRARGGLASLPSSAVVGTGSLRRAAFLRAMRPDVAARDIRGNVDTRLRKVREGEYDAVVVALAGLRRLGVEVREEEILSLAEMPPAPGQGALAVQCRADDERVLARLAAIDDARARAATEAERECLRALGGSCDLPLGAYAWVEDGELVLEAALVRGGTVERARERQSVAQAGFLGRLVADRLRRGELSGAVVVLTREPHDNAALAAELLARGAEVAEMPCVRTEHLDDPSELAASVRALGEDDLLVVTSPRGAEAVLRAVAPAELRAPVTAMGRASAMPLLRAGIACAVADASTGDALGRALPLPRGRVLLARSDRALPHLADALRARGVRVEDVVAYRTLPGARGDVGKARLAVRSEAAIVVLASPSAVDGFAGAIAPHELRARVVAIGRTTAARVRERLGVEPVVADAPTLPKLIDAIGRCAEEVRHVAHA